MQEKGNQKILVTTRKIGSTTYIIKSLFDKNAKSDATSKVVWLVGKKIQNEQKAA